MAAGRRLALVHQAALVWELGETDIDDFVCWGRINKAPKQPRFSPELRAGVDRYIDQIMTTGRLHFPTAPDRP